MKIIWAEEVDNINTMLSEGVTLQEIGKHYKVSKQRIYQVLTKFGISTPLRKRKNKLVDKEPKYYWTNKMLKNKGLSSKDIIYFLENREIPEECPILGITLNYLGTGSVGFSRREDSPSIDKIDPSGDYNLNNIAIISWRANRIKNDGTEIEHRKIADFIRDYKFDK